MESRIVDPAAFIHHSPSGEGNAPLFSLENFGLGFGPRTILADISFSLGGTGIVVLMGPGGTGKSTLLNAMAGRVASARRRQWGEMKYLGNSLNSCAEFPALVQQHPRDLGRTVWEGFSDVLRARLFLTPAKLREHVVTVLHDLGAEELLAKLDTPVIDLAQAQSRMVAILRASFSNTPLLLIDEPTTGLSAEDARRVLNLITKIAGDRLCLMVLHNQAQARERAQRVILLAGGRVQADASVDDFFANKPGHPVLAQFIRTGSCYVPGPDAVADDLDETVSVPPPLPEQSIDADAGVSQEVPTDPASVYEIGAHQSSDEPIAVDEVSGDVFMADEVGDDAFAADDVIADEVAADEVTADEVTADEVAADDVDTNESELAVTAEVAAYADIPQGLMPEDGDAMLHPMLVPENSSFPPILDALPASRGPSGFHWLVPGRLAGCPMPGVILPVDHDMALLRGMGVTLLINLTERPMDEEVLARNGLRSFHVSVVDRCAPPLLWAKLLLAKIETFLRTGEVVAVHCLAGLGRTGTVLGAWLVREGLTAEESLRRLRGINPGFVQSQEQEDLLHELETNLLIRAT